MSNYLAIATVTAALRDLLQEAVGIDEAVARVTTARPDESISSTPETKVNIYLYQLTPNAGWRNMDIPTRRTDGTVVQRPQVALDLHYMISFYGDESQLMSQRMLGSVVRTLYAQPILTRDRIRQTIANAVDSGSFPFLATSNLADDVELVKFTPLHLSLEEQSKIWSVFFQIPYVLSVAYLATVVLIEGDEIPRKALPVRLRNFYAVPFRQPVIEHVIVREGVNLPITMDSTISIVGQRLRGQVTLVRISGVDVLPEAKDVSDTRVSLSLAAAAASLQAAGASLQAGVQGLQIVHQQAMGIPLAPHKGVESDVAAFMLHPVIGQSSGDISTANMQGAGDSPRSGDMVLKNIKPAIGKSQRVTLMLDEFNPDQLLQPDRLLRAYNFDAPPRNQASDPSDSITIPIKNVMPGSYLVRLQVDGAESLLDINPDGLYAAPQVTIV